MKIYVTARFKGSADNKAEIEALCGAIEEADMKAFHFIRDIENYQPNFFSSQDELWETAKKCIDECDALLIDVSDAPSGGRLIEAGIAYALNKPVYVIAKKGTSYKGFYEGVAESILEYDSVDEVTSWLRSF